MDLQVTAVQSIFAIVPVKPLEEGKSRLRAVLSQSEREHFNGLLLDRTLGRLTTFPGAARTIVVSRSETVLLRARRMRMICVSETGKTLNAALSAATRVALRLGATTVVAVPIDLPLAETTDLKRLVELAAHDKTCVVVPDAAHHGTNLLIATPPHKDIYRFGGDSFSKHQEIARHFGFNVLVEEDPRIAFDVDEPADYYRWLSMCSRPEDAIQLLSGG